MGDTSAVMSVADIMAAAASCTAVNTMYSGVVEEVTRAEQVQIKIRSVEGKDFTLLVKPEEKMAKIKQEIWNNIGSKTQLKIGEAIVDFMTEYIQTTDLSYEAFHSLTEEQQISVLAKNGKFYQLFWKHYMVLYDNHIIEDEATVVGLGLVNGDELGVFPREILGKKENLYLQLFLGIKRHKPEVEIGTNELKGPPFGLPIATGDAGYHEHKEAG